MFKSIKKSSNLMRAALLVCLGTVIGLTVSVIIFISAERGGPRERVYAQEYEGVQVSQDSSGFLSPLSLQNSFRDIIKRVLPSIVTITAEKVYAEGDEQQQPWFDYFFRLPDSQNDNREFRTQGLGSGIIVRRVQNTYYVLTNMHVIGDADRLKIVLDNSDEYRGTVVGMDERKDVAMVSFRSDKDIPVVVLGDSETLQVGDWVLAIGSPFNLQSTVTAGIVSALGRHGGPQRNISDFIQTDAAINQGNSGGALVNLNGDVIGMNTWITSNTGLNIGLGFSIPINNIKRAIDAILVSGSVEYGWIGVSIRTVDDDIASQLALPNNDGALISSVYIDSPAHEGGLLPGDFITTINGMSLRNSDDLVLRVGDLPIGERANFHIIRGDKNENITIRISNRRNENSIDVRNNLLWPGMSVVPIGPAFRNRNGDNDIPTYGVVIERVEQRTPAAAAGLRSDDLLLNLADRRISNMADFYRLLNALSGENSFEIELLRQGERSTVTIEKKNS